MHTVASFHASAVTPDQLSGITADYLALERAKVLRRLLVKRVGGLAALIAAVSVFWLSAFAFWLSLGLCAVAPVWAWMVELRCERRLAHRLDEVPGDTMHVVRPAAPIRVPSGRNSQKVPT